MYVPSTSNIISSYDVVFDKIVYSALAYTSQHHSEAMAMRPAVTYTLYATSLKEQTGNVIMLAQFVLLKTSHTEYTSLLDASPSLLNKVVTYMLTH